MSNFQKVKVFHETFGLESLDSPGWPKEPDTLRLRINLIKEEAIEVIKALNEEGLPEIAKELADLLYVTYGTAVSFGIDLDQVFAEVHRSNMSKLTKDGKVLRRETDGKVLKSDQYTPADVETVLGLA